MTIHNVKIRYKHFIKTWLTHKKVAKIFSHEYTINPKIIKL